MDLTTRDNQSGYIGSEPELGCPRSDAPTALVSQRFLSVHSTIFSSQNQEVIEPYFSSIQGS
jgi:hypothetical protein